MIIIFTGVYENTVKLLINFKQQIVKYFVNIILSLSLFIQNSVIDLETCITKIFTKAFKKLFISWN